MNSIGGGIVNFKEMTIDNENSRNAVTKPGQSLTNKKNFETSINKPYHLFE